MATVTQTVGRQTVGFLLEPLDVLFFRDGRPFGAATRAASLAVPLPQTLAGAVWTHLLTQYDCSYQQLRRRVTGQRQTIAEALDALGMPSWIHQIAIRGPWPARIPLDNNSVQPDVLLPVPAILKDTEDGADDRNLIRLHPLSDARLLPGWGDTFSGRHGLRPLWTHHRQSTKAATGFLTASGTRAFLHGDAVSCSELVKMDDLFAWDNRTGIAIEPSSQTAAESLIYAARFVVPRCDLEQNCQTVFYAEVTLPDDAPQDVFTSARTLAFGGEGRRVTIRPLDHPFDWHALEPQATDRESDKPLLLLTTPGLFDEPWCPGVVRDRLVSACVPGGLAISGWDMARGGPKPSRSAAMPGSVYLLDRPIESPPDSLADEHLDRQQGWGCYLTGVWNDEKR